MPAEAPVTVPVVEVADATVATSVAELLQTPPAVLLLKVVAAPLQTSKPPEMAWTAGKALTVMVAVVLLAEVHPALVTTAL